MWAIKTLPKYSQSALALFFKIKPFKRALFQADLSKLHLSRNVTDYGNSIGVSATRPIVFYDEANAFDRVAREYLFIVLRPHQINQNALCPFI